ncbi:MULTISPECIES: hypothetical protein [unclassified Marinobacter]|uniref:hypothetical protein n=1 Tax=unclassified Marinobacter TaxID=83889 RepID=UPI0019266C98|nr:MULTISPECIES: hypothetical protein [unclassified Marinobacter]MBL3825129.1 hypothetical protein [Marinobacter sp. MC3]MBL3893667.1 hypothetical protein [Marinobacter sp. MW3]
MMGLSLRNFWAIVFVVVALFLLAAVPAAEGSEVPAFTAVDDSTELIADTATDTGAVQSDARALQRLPESPGGVIAKVTNSTKVTDNAKEVLPGGAAGVASIGIRGPTTS